MDAHLHEDAVSLSVHAHRRFLRLPWPASGSPPVDHGLRDAKTHVPTCSLRAESVSHRRCWNATHAAPVQGALPGWPLSEGASMLYVWTDMRQFPGARGQSFLMLCMHACVHTYVCCMQSDLCMHLLVLRNQPYCYGADAARTDRWSPGPSGASRRRVSGRCMPVQVKRRTSP